MCVVRVPGPSSNIYLSASRTTRDGPSYLKRTYSYSVHALLLVDRVRMAHGELGTGGPRGADAAAADEAEHADGAEPAAGDEAEPEEPRAEVGVEVGALVPLALAGQREDGGRVEEAEAGLGKEEEAWR